MVSFFLETDAYEHSAVHQKTTALEGLRDLA